MTKPERAFKWVRHKELEHDTIQFVRSTIPGASAHEQKRAAIKIVKALWPAIKLKYGIK